MSNRDWYNSYRFLENGTSRAVKKNGWICVNLPKESSISTLSLYVYNSLFHTKNFAFCENNSFVPLWWTIKKKHKQSKEKEHLEMSLWKRKTQEWEGGLGKDLWWGVRVDGAHDWEGMLYSLCRRTSGPSHLQQISNKGQNYLMITAGNSVVCFECLLLFKCIWT